MMRRQNRVGKNDRIGLPGAIPATFGANSAAFCTRSKPKHLSLTDETRQKHAPFETSKERIWRLTHPCRLALRGSNFSLQTSIS